MNEREASRMATLIASRWPTRILATVNTPINREDDQGYSVRVFILRKNRILRLGRAEQLPGILDVCAMLMTPDSASRPLPAQTIPHLAKKKEEKAMSIEQMEQQAQESDTFSEEEAATYLGVKPVTIRTYANNDTLTRQPDGGFLLADLRRYKDARRSRGQSASGDPMSAPAPAPERLLTEAPEGAVAPTALTTSLAPVSPERDICPSEEERITHAVVAHVFATVSGIRSLGRLSEVPRSWKVDVMTERGPESYRVMRGIDGSVQQERW